MSDRDASLSLKKKKKADLPVETDVTFLAKARKAPNKKTIS